MRVAMIAKNSPTGSAVYSDCMNYRYELRRFFYKPKSLFDAELDGLVTDPFHDRYWPLPNVVNFIMLNPSTATETDDDPTIRRCIGYAKEWGAEALIITNVFAFRSTDPLALNFQSDPVGRDNNELIKKVALASDLIVCAWGEHAALHDRGASVKKMLIEMGVKPTCLKKNKSGQPCHPLYLKADLKPVQL